MRITAGLHRGRKLVSPEGRNTRPTGDRARESVFNVLRHGKWCAGVLEGATVLDAFAGTGALGLEALSQGAASAVFMEKDRAAAAICRENVTQLKETDHARVLVCDATLPPVRDAGVKPATLVFLDPPYALGLGEKALISLTNGGWLAPDAVCVLEMSKKSPEVIPPDFTIVDTRTYGIAQVQFMVWRGGR